MSATNSPFDSSHTVSFEETLNLSYTACPHGLGLDIICHVCHAMPPQHPSSYPGYVHTDESDADTLSPYYYDFPQQGGANLDADTYANVRRSFFPGQELNHSYNGMNGASFAPPIASGPYNSCPSSTTGTASPEMNHLISFSDSQSIPSPSPSGVTEQSSGVEYEGMTTAIPPETQYRERIATPKVVEISQSRRKKGGNSFKCEKCGATLTSRQNLKYHTNAHFNIKPFLCGECQKRFGTPHDRNRHYKKCAIKSQGGTQFVNDGPPVLGVNDFERPE